MASRAPIDAKKAIALHKRGMQPKDIAYRLGCRQPAIYRAFRKNGYFTKGMKRSALGPERNYPPEARIYGDTSGWRSDFDAEEREIAERRILPRDPCTRCGTRGDLGCGCSKAPVGWRAG